MLLMNINDYKNQNCECGKPQRAKPRLLTHRVSEAEAGRSVQSLLRNEMQLSGGLAARNRVQPTGKLPAAII